MKTKRICKRVVCICLAGVLCAVGVPASVLPAATMSDDVALAAQAAQRTVNFHYCTPDNVSGKLTWQSVQKTVNVGSAPSWNSAYLNDFIAGTPGAKYVFLGWSASGEAATESANGQTADANDYVAKNKALPAVEDGSGDIDYWAVYRKTVLRYEVQFVDGDTTYTAEDVAYGAMLADVWAGNDAAFVDGKAAWKSEAPADDPAYCGDEEDMEFAGWAATEGASAPENPSLTANGKKFYPVFSKIPSCNVTFSVDGQDVASADALAGTPLSEAYTQTPVAYGKRFAGWADSSNARVSTVPRADKSTLHALWADIGAYADDASGSTLDVSKAYVGVAGIEDASDVYASIDYVSGSGEFGTLAEADGYEYQAAFAVQLRVERADGVERIETGFGQITAHLCWGSIHEGDKVKVYWIRADGTQGSTTKTAGNNGVECSFSTLSMTSETNVAMALIPEYLNTDTTESDAQKAAVDRSAHVDAIESKDSKSKSKKSSKSSTSSSKSKSAKSSKSAKGSKSAKSRSAKSSKASKKSSSSKTSVSTGTTSRATGSSSSSSGFTSQAATGTGASLVNRSGTGSTLTNTASADSAEDSATSGSNLANSDQNEAAENAEQNTQDAQEAPQAQPAQDAGAVPEQAESAQETPSVPFSPLLIVAGALAIAAAAAAFMIFGRRRKGKQEEQVQAPLTAQDESDIAAANF